MNSTQAISEKLFRSGVYLWDVDMDNRTIIMSDSLRYLLGFQQEVITTGAVTALMPEEFRASLRDRITNYSEWPMPIYCPSGLVWLDMHKLQTIESPNGSKRYLGTARQMTEEEVGSYISESGVNVDTLSPLVNAIHLTSEDSTFDEGVHMLLTTIRTQIVGVRVGLMRWEGGSHFTMIDYVGGMLIDQFGNSAVHYKPIISEMNQRICESGKAKIEVLSADELEDWPMEKKFFVRNGAKSVLAVPIITDDNRVWGMIGILSPTRTVWSAFEKQWIGMISSWLSLCIRRTDLMKDMNEQLYISSQACDLGDILTWTWNRVSSGDIVITYSRPDNTTLTFSLNGFENNVHKNDRMRLNKITDQTLRKKTDIIETKLRIRKTKTDKMEWYDIKGRVTSYDKDGIPQKIVGISKNIDAQVRQKAKEKSEIDFQNSIYNNIPAGIEFYNEEGKLIYMNQTAFNVLGIKANDKRLFGLDLFDNPNLTEETKQTIRDKDEAVFHFTYDFMKARAHYPTTKDDSMDVIFKTSKLYTKGKFSGYMIIIVDNSELAKQTKQVEIFRQYFLEIGKFAKIGICWFTDSVNGYVSEQWNMNLGVDPNMKFVRNLSPCTRVVDEDLEIYGSLLRRIFLGDIESFQHELRVNQEDNKLHYIKVQFLRTTDAITGISIDVTQTRENERMLISARGKAERADMLKSQFLANMSHEIRTPLNAIVGFSDLIAQSVDSPEARMYSDIVRTNNDILLNTIGDIIDLSKIESNTMEMNYGINNINDIGVSVYNVYSSKAHKKVEFTYTPCQEELTAYCDKGHVAQIVSNLVSNALKFTATGKVNLHIQKTDSEIVFNVTDTGCGIPSDKIDKIFDPYTKLDVFSVGTGLGLSICKSLAASMNGKIEVTSTEGKGSHFKLVIPYISAEDAHLYQTSNIDGCIMLLSNDKENIQFVSYTLDQYPIILEQEHVFMTLWLEKKPMMTIIDQQMFGDSIADVVQSLHNHGTDHQVIVICRTGVVIDIDAIEKAGAAAVVYTPVTSDGFKDVVSRCLKANGHSNNVSTQK